MSIPRRPPLNDPETYAIIGAAMEVHRVLGSGFLEVVYRRALHLEFLLRGIPFEHEVPLPVRYKGELLPVHYRVDFICEGKVLVEAKAQAALGRNDLAQAINYLKASHLSVALLLNFGAERLEYRRIVLGLSEDPLLLRVVDPVAGDDDAG